MVLDFDLVYTQANRTYNEGYEKLGKSEVKRPVLKHYPGSIGGHCIIPNAKILNDSLADLLLERNLWYTRDMEGGPSRNSTTID